jgi:ribosomal protein S18
MWFLLNYNINNVMNEVRDIKEDQEIMSNEIGYVYDDIEALSNYVTYHEKVGHNELENNEENE